jgi:hypothetical protein
MGMVEEAAILGREAAAVLFPIAVATEVSSSILKV